MDARDAEQQIIDGILAKDPKNFELRFRQLWPEFGKILIRIESGDTEQGVDDLIKMAGQLALLSEESPNNTEVKRAWARAYYVRTKTLLAINSSDAQNSLSETKKLLSEIGKTPEQRQALAGFYKGISEFEQQIANGEIIK